MEPDPDAGAEMRHCQINWAAVLAGTDFFTVNVLTLRGLVTFLGYTVVPTATRSKSSVSSAPVLCATEGPSCKSAES